MMSRKPASSRLAVGIDLGGTNLKVGLVSREGRMLASRAATTPPGPDATLDLIATEVRELLRAAGVDRSAIIGVGIGTPGPLSPSRGVIFNCANLPGWINVPIRDRLASLLGWPVVLDNDGNMAGFGEYWVGAATRGGNPSDERAPDCAGDMVALTLGTGVGCGIVIGGRILHGHFENAAEAGHMIVERNGRPCPCGQRGCLEQYSSASALVRRAAEELAAGNESLLRARVLDMTRLTARDVAEAARDGDALAQRLWSDACEYLAIACVNLQHLINPATIVLGGGLAEAGDLLLTPVRDAFRRHQWSLTDDFPHIARAALGYDAGTIGAAGWAWRTFAHDGAMS